MYWSRRSCDLGWSSSSWSSKRRNSEFVQFQKFHMFQEFHGIPKISEACEACVPQRVDNSVNLIPMATRFSNRRRRTPPNIAGEVLAAVLGPERLGLLADPDVSPRSDDPAPAPAGFSRYQHHALLTFLRMHGLHLIMFQTVTLIH